MASSIRINTINHVGIPIWDRRVSLPFYRDILGLQVIPSMVDEQNIVWTRTLDGNRIEIVTRCDHASTSRTADENGYTSEGGELL